MTGKVGIGVKRSVPMPRKIDIRDINFLLFATHGGKKKYDKNYRTQPFHVTQYTKKVLYGCFFEFLKRKWTSSL